MEGQPDTQVDRSTRVSEAAAAMGVNSVGAVARIVQEIENLEANGHNVDDFEHTRRALMRVE